MKLKSIFKQIIREQSDITLKRIKTLGDYTEYDIILDKNQIGFLSASTERSYLKIDVIQLNPEFQNKGLGTKILKQSLEILKKQFPSKYLEYYAVSVQSAKAAVKAFGNPIKMDTPFGEWDDFQIAIDKSGIPTTASVDADGDLTMGEDDALRLVFEI